jgi:transposase InsO family protein
MTSAEEIRQLYQPEAGLPEAAAIRQLYRDPKKGLIGVKAFSEKHYLPVKKVEEALRGEDVYTQNRPAVSKFERRKTFVDGIDEQWQADLMDMVGQLDANDGYRYILCVIDCFSKYAWAVPLKTKGAAEVAKAFQKVLDSGRKPKKLQTDDGTEFFNRSMESLLKNNDIQHFSTFSPLKATIVERFNRTLRMRLTRLWDVQKTFNWIDKLSDVIENYNNTKHSSIGMTPTEASRPENEAKVFQRLFPPKYQPEAGPREAGNLGYRYQVDDHSKASNRALSVGDYVRIQTERGVFTKEQVNKWSTEIFQIEKVLPTSPVTYHLKDLSGEEVKGGFYRQELQPVDKPEKFGIEILDRRTVKKGRKNVKQLYVHWQGYPKSMDEWIDESQLE